MANSPKRPRSEPGKAASGKPSRRVERQTAFQVLYGLAYSDKGGAGPVDHHALRYAFAKSPVATHGEEPELTEEPIPDRPVEGFAWELARGVWINRVALDEQINQLSQHWRVSRIAKIELTILRLALYEMLYRTDVPTKVAINEAVELAKRYGDEHSKSFVNGILDAAARALDNGEIGVHQGR